MSNDSLEQTKPDLEQSERLEQMWDEYLAWCRANENSAHE
jgi:hypothetical protein